MRAGLAEMLDAERADAVAVDAAEPGERRGMAVEDGDDAGSGAEPRPAVARHGSARARAPRSRARWAA